MQFIVVLALLSACILAAQTVPYSFSPPVGSGCGSSYALTGEGRITAIRLWERYSYYIYGIQLRHGVTWSRVAGYGYGTLLEMELYDDEGIVQISGKYSHTLRSLIFHTNKGRALYAGQPYGRSFNMYAPHPDAELLFVSGRGQGCLTAIGAHWGSPGVFVGNGTSH